MTPLDFVIIAVVLISALIGLFRGFVKEVLSLINWLAALLVAWFFAPTTAVMLEQWIASPTLRLVLAFAGLFLVTLLTATILSHFLHRLVVRGGLKGTDRSLGVLFGIARGVVILTVAVLLAGTTTIPQETWWQGSLLIGYLEGVATTVVAYLPPDIAGYFSYR